MIYDKKNKKLLWIVLTAIILAVSCWCVLTSLDVIDQDDNFSQTINLESKLIRQSFSDSDKALDINKDLIQQSKIDKQINKDDKLIDSAKGLSPKVLHLALKAYYNAVADNQIDNHKLTIIDYSLPANKKRMWVIDMEKKSILMNTYVSHGARSGDKMMAKEFSNKLGSHKSSVGVMKTGAIYHGNRGMSLHLHGLEEDINDNVYNRHVVIHGSNYVNESSGKVGRSFGCPAVDHKVAKPLIKKIANGSLVFAYYPLKSWLNNSEYLA